MIGNDLQVERRAQLQRLSTEDVDGILRAIRQAQTIPRLAFHFKKHGWSVGALDEGQYFRALRQHLVRGDPRLFTYLRRDLVPFWELVAPDTGSTVMYNEHRGLVWSFFRPEDAAARMLAVQEWWVEVTRTEAGWVCWERWRWKK